MASTNARSSYNRESVERGCATQTVGEDREARGINMKKINSNTGQTLQGRDTAAPGETSLPMVEEVVYISVE